MPVILVGLGSNLGDRQRILDSAVKQLRREFTVTNVSDWFSYPAVGGPEGQQDFLNGCVVAETQKTPHATVKVLQQIEVQAGRERVVRWDARTLDCDLLLFGDQEIFTDDLEVPHPRMHTRRFVLEPAHTVAADMVHPRFGWTVEDLFHNLERAKPIFCIVGSNPTFVDELAAAISKATGLELYTRQQLAGTKPNQIVDWLTRTTTFHKNSGNGAVSGFWAGEPWLHNPLHSEVDANQIVQAKLLICADPRGSDYAKQFDLLPTSLRVPTLFLSAERTSAIQDAVGCVLAMN